MADYKELLSGLADKAKGILDGVSEKGGVKEIYSQGLSRAKEFGNIAKLTLEINSLSEELKKVYTEIGKLYFEENRDKPEGFYSGLFAKVEELSEKIRGLDDEIKAMKDKIDGTEESPAAEEAEEEDVSDIEVEIVEEQE